MSNLTQLRHLKGLLKVNLIEVLLQITVRIIFKMINRKWSKTFRLKLQFTTSFTSQKRIAQEILHFDQSILLKFLLTNQSQQEGLDKNEKT